MKKLLAIFLALACLLGLTACGGEKLEEPPELRIVSADGTVTASKGTYSWFWNTFGGMSTGVESDSIHPLDFQPYVETLFTDDFTVALEFDVKPDTVAVRECWSDEHWGDDYDTPSETAELTSVNDTLNVTLKQSGGWIYVISASWEHKNYHGSSDYVFHVVTPELQATEQTATMGAS